LDTHDTIITLLEFLITFVTAFAASSGFWVYMEKKRASKDISKRLLIGLAHDRIIYLSMKCITRGEISKDEYENLNMFLYQPFLELGGNGAAKRLMAEVDKLKIIDINFEYLKGVYNDSNQQGV